MEMVKHCECCGVVISDMNVPGTNFHRHVAIRFCPDCRNSKTRKKGRQPETILADVPTPSDILHDESSKEQISKTEQLNKLKEERAAHHKKIEERIAELEKENALLRQECEALMQEARMLLQEKSILEEIVPQQREAVMEEEQHESMTEEALPKNTVPEKNKKTPFLIATAAFAITATVFLFTKFRNRK